MRMFRAAIVASVMWALAFGAIEARADGLSQFQTLIAAKAKPGTLSYGSASPLGASGFVLTDVTLTPPPEAAGAPGPVRPGPVKISRLAVEAIDFDSIAKDQPPLFLHARLEGVSFSPDTLSGLDIEKYLGGALPPADVVLDYRLDSARQTFTLTRFELNLRGLGRLELSLAVDGVTAEAAGAPQSAMGTASLRSAALVFEDASLVSRLMTAVATEQKMPPAQQAEMAAGMLTGMTQDFGPLTKAAVEPLVAFLRDWERPKGAFRVTLSPPAKVTAAMLGQANSPDDVVKALGLSVTYGGTPAATPRPAVTGQAAPQAAPAKLTGLAAWNVLVGNTVIGTIDGKVLVDYYQKDGVVKSLADSELTVGRWQLEGEQICFKYPDEDKACYTIEVVGKTVTFLDSRGTGMRLELHEGNPKNL